MEAHSIETLRLPHFPTLYHQEDSWYSLGQLKNPMTPSGIKPTTLRACSTVPQSITAPYVPWRRTEQEARVEITRRKCK
jgi:hypothetical protein